MSLIKQSADGNLRSTIVPYTRWQLQTKQYQHATHQMADRDTEIVINTYSM